MGQNAAEPVQPRRQEAQCSTPSAHQTCASCKRHSCTPIAYHVLPITLPKHAWANEASNLCTYAQDMVPTRHTVYPYDTQSQSPKGVAISAHMHNAGRPPSTQCYHWNIKPRHKVPAINAQRHNAGYPPRPQRSHCDTKPRHKEASSQCPYTDCRMPTRHTLFP